MNNIEIRDRLQDDKAACQEEESKAKDHSYNLTKCLVGKEGATSILFQGN